MGYINKIIPKALKPISRDIGFSFYSLYFKIKCIGKNLHPSPIFILGNQKSGTSAIAALLGKLTVKSTAIDLFYSGFNFHLFTKWKNKEISTSAFVRKNKIEFAKKIIKEPHLSVFYTELKTQYPNSKFVMIMRNPIDNIRSILDRLDIDGHKNELNNEDIKKIFHSWNLLFSNHWIGGYKRQYIEVLAERWNIIMDSYFTNKEDIILIKYEDFLKDKIGILNKLSEELGLKNKADIATLLNKAFQPKGKKSNQSPLAFFGEENLNKIIELCRKNSQKLGY